MAERGSKAVSYALDLQSCRLKHGCAWVKFLDAESVTVRPSRQESEVTESSSCSQCDCSPRSSSSTSWRTWAGGS